MEEVGRADLGELGRLVLYGSREDAHPGQIVTGMVNLRIDVVPLLIKGIWVKLSGKSSVNAAHADLGTHFLSLDDTHSNAGESSGTFIDLMRGEEDYFHGGVSEVFAGTGEECANNEYEDEGQMDLLELTDAEYSWHFALKLPEDCPFSYHDEHVDVSYSLSVHLDTPAVARSVSRLTHTVVVGAVCDGQSLQEVDASRRILGFEDQDSNHPHANSSPSSSSLLGRLGACLCLSNSNAPSIGVKLGQPAVFAFEGSRTLLKMTSVARHLPTRHRFFKVSHKVLVLTTVRANEFVDFDDRSKRTQKYLHKSEQVLWQEEKKIRLSQNVQQDDYLLLEVPQNVPIEISLKEKHDSLRDWPCAAPLTHNTGKVAKVLTFSMQSLLVRVQYVLQSELSTGPKTDGPFVCVAQSQGEILVLPPSVAVMAEAVEAEAAVGEGEGVSMGAGGAHHGMISNANNSVGNSNSNMNGSNASNASSSMSGLGLGDLPRAAPKTPQAVLAPVRVVGELISRGPSAVLVDAGRRSNRENPPADRFAQLFPVNMNDVECLAGHPTFSPALAYIYHVSPRTGIRTIERSRQPRGVVVVEGGVIGIERAVEIEGGIEQQGQQEQHDQEEEEDHQDRFFNAIVSSAQPTTPYVGRSPPTADSARSVGSAQSAGSGGTDFMGSTGGSVDNHGAVLFEADDGEGEGNGSNSGSSNEELSVSSGSEAAEAQVQPQQSLSPTLGTDLSGSRSGGDTSFSTSTSNEAGESGESGAGGSSLADVDPQSTAHSPEASEASDTGGSPVTDVESQSTTPEADNTRLPSPLVEGASTVAFSSTLGQLFRDSMSTESERGGEGEGERGTATTEPTGDGDGDASFEALLDALRAQASPAAGAASTKTTKISSAYGKESLDTAMCVRLLKAVASSAEREGTLLHMVHNKWLQPDALPSLLGQNGCIDQCFDLHVQRENIKSSLRADLDIL